MATATRTKTTTTKATTKPRKATAKPTKQAGKATTKQDIPSLLAAYSKATTPGVKAGISKKIKALGGTPPVAAKVTAPVLPASKANLSKLVKERDAAKTPGVKAGLTKKVKAMEALLASK